MRKKEGKKSASILVLLALGAFALVFQLGAAGALAQVQDDDKDGFSNTLETAGFILGTGISLNTYPQLPDPTKMLNCAASNLPRDQCVDPNAKDLFVIIKRATTACPPPTTSCTDPCSPMYGYSNIPMPPYDPNNILDPLALVRAGGLGVTAHGALIQTSGTSQLIGGPGGYYAMKVVEDLNPCSPWMGSSVFGTFDSPYTGGVATVWPEYIKNWIAKKCSEACFTDRSGTTTCYHPNDSDPRVLTFNCKNANSTTSVNMIGPDQALVKKLNQEFIQNIIDHEVSHLIHLASASGTVEHHYPIAQGVLMEQFINTKVTKDAKGNINVILYISKTYTRDDTGDFWLIKNMQ